MSSSNSNAVRRIFPEAVDLRTYLQQNLPSQENLLRSDDSIYFKKFLDDIYVVSNSLTTVRAESIADLETNKAPIREVLNRIVVQMIRSNGNGRDQNCLSLGYRQKAANSEMILRNHHDIECAYINTLHNLVTTQNWQILLDRIGSKELRTLLSNPIFLKTSNESFLQLSGSPSNDLVYSIGNPFFQRQGVRNASNKRAFNDSASSLKPSISGKSIIIRSKSLYSLRPFANKGVQHISELFQRFTDVILPSELELQSFDEFKLFVNTVRERICKDMVDYDFQGAFVKYCVATKPNSSPQQKPAILSKKRRRGTRAGLSHKRKRLLSVISNEAAQPSPSQPFQLSSSEKSEAIIKLSSHLPVISVGEQLLARLVSGVDQDGRHQHFETQESTQISKHSNHTKEQSETSPGDLKNDKPEQATFLRFSSHNRIDITSGNAIQSILRKKRRRKKRKLNELHPSVITAPSEQERDLGIMMHSRRQFLTIPSRKDSHLDNQEMNWMDNAVSEEEKRQEALALKQKEKEIFELSVPPSAVSEYIKSIVRYLFSIKDFWGNSRNLRLLMRKIDHYLHLGRHEGFCLEQVMHGIQVNEFPMIKEYRRLFSQREKESPMVGYRMVYWLFNDFINSLLANAFYMTEIEGKGSQVFYFQKKVWYEIVRTNMTAFNEQFVPIVITEEFLKDQERLFTTSHSNAGERSGNRDLKRVRTDPISTSMSIAPTAVSITTRDSLRSEARVSSTTLEESVNSTSVSTTADKPERSILFNDWIQRQSLATTKSQVNSHRLLPQSLQSLPQETNNSLNDLMRRVLPDSLKVSQVLHHQNRFLTPQQIHQQSPKLRHYLRQIPTIRFLPKKATIRPITNLRSRSSGRKTSFSTPFAAPSLEIVNNRMLYNLYSVLKTLFDKNLYLIKGFSVFGLDEIYQRLCSYKLSLIQQGKNSAEPFPSLYAMALDLQKCYDHIHLPLLYDILHHLLTGEAFPYEQYFPSQVLSSKSTDTGETEPSIEKVFPENEATIHRYTVIHTIHSMKRVIVKPIKMVTFQHQILPFEKVGQLLAKSYPNSLIQDHVITSKLSVKEILRLLKQHLFSHVIKMPMNHCFSARSLKRMNQNNDSCNLQRRKSDKKKKKRQRRPQNAGRRQEVKKAPRARSLQVHTHFYTQVRGIPQGSILSPLFCNIYYGFLERTFFSLSSSSSSKRPEEDHFGLVKGETMVIRMIDDYLMVSTDFSHLQTIFHIISKEFALFGGKVHAQKIQTNFDPRLLGLSSGCSEPRSDSTLNYCGLKVYSQTLLFEPHLDKIFPSMSCPPNPSPSTAIARLYDTITINYAQVTFGFQKSLKQFFRIKCHAIFLDDQINHHPEATTIQTKQWIAKNVYQLFLLTAFRGFLYLEKLHRYYFRHLITEDYIFRCLEEVIFFAFALISIRTNHSIFRRVSLDDLHHVQEEEEGEEEEAAEGKGRKHLTYGGRTFIDTFGSCPLQQSEVHCLGWKAFQVLSQFYPQAYRLRSKRQGWSLSGSRQNHQTSQLPGRITRRYQQELRKLKILYFGEDIEEKDEPDLSRSTSINSSASSPFERLVGMNLELVIQHLLPLHLSSSCEEYFLGKLKD